MMHRKTTQESTQQWKTPPFVTTPRAGGQGEAGRYDGAGELPAAQTCQTFKEGTAGQKGQKQSHRSKEEQKGLKRQGQGSTIPVFLSHVEIFPFLETSRWARALLRSCVSSPAAKMIGIEVCN